MAFDEVMSDLDVLESKISELVVRIKTLQEEKKVLMAEKESITSQFNSDDETKATIKEKIERILAQIDEITQD